jgi:gliding motility-associated-like protein
VLTASGASTYTWSPATYLSTSTGSSVTVTAPANATYTFVGTSSNGCTAQSTATSSIYTTPIITVSGGQVVCQGSSSTLIASGGAGYTWAPASALSNTVGSTVTALPVNNTTYTVTATYGSNCTTQSTYIVSVCSIFIPTGMSPNGDGKNDNWDIKGVEQFEDLSISVFNLQGQLVHYQIVHYQRNNYIPWNGTINGVMAPVGDYYFVIESIPNKIRKTGTLTISY